MHISTHVLDIGLGLPAKGIEVELFGIKESEFVFLARSVTDSDGRVGKFDFPGQMQVFQLRFAVGKYFAAAKRESFYERVQIEFKVESGREKLHVPLLLNAYGYSTYRGS